MLARIATRRFIPTPSARLSLGTRRFNLPLAAPTSAAPRFTKSYSTVSPPPSPPPQPPHPTYTSLILNLVKYALGAGALGVVGFFGFVGYKIYAETHPGKQQPQSATFPTGERKKTLVILGSGWGAVALLKNLDTTLYNVVLVSPRNYFLFTPLLPSVPTGTVDMKSIIEPVRAITRLCKGQVVYYEAEAVDIDPETNTLKIQQSTTVHSGHSKESSGSTKSEKIGDGTLEYINATLQYDYLVVGIGAQPSTFGLPGVAQHSTFVKEVGDSMRIKKTLIDLVEAANLLPKDDKDRKRLLHVIVCGGGPTGVEAAGEIQDYIDQDLKKWMPEVAKDLKVTLVESQPKVLHTFSPQLVEYTNQVFQDTNINLVTNARINSVDDKYCTVFHKDTKETEIVPYGMLIWATGNATRSFTHVLMQKVPEQKNAKRGFLVDKFLKLQGSSNIFALGDCTFTKYPPTAQVAHQQGDYLANYFNKLQKLASLKYKIDHDGANASETLKTRAARLEANLPHFVYNYQGSLAYIGSEKAVADLAWGSWSNVSTGGNLTYLFWRSAYIYMCLSVKNQVLICIDWLKVYAFGRDCSRE
ncbi:NDE1 [Candida metapsilosis]|uniref:NADH:ubiquinone reductase (non-electrogenic) n=1 Tax=Candida metapsilosis TaxID=273372 RepID=A0A8H7ZKX4_9ASCO|nr:NDE1 [Candida metapsilosis]